MKEKIKVKIEKIIKNKFFLITLLCIVFFAIGFFTQRMILVSESKEISQTRQTGYKFINPLLECEVNDSLNNQKYIPFEDKVKSEIKSDVIAKNKKVFVSVYFRNLNNGPWFGINEKENFTPASLMKVPLMMAYFKLAEDDNQLLAQEIEYRSNGEVKLEQAFSPQEKLVTGKKYSIMELIERMMTFSDNAAMELLLKNINQNKLDSIYTDLGINIPDVRKADDFMTVKEYASFFRILYNSSYLKNEKSEKALEILTNTYFKEGLVEGVPEDILVAHKFGERRNNDIPGGYNVQLHDCGIIYNPKYPYLLCVMTRGENFEELTKIVKNISTIVWGNIEENFGK